MEDDARMRQGEDFDVLRKNYPVRREFSSLQLQGITNTECLAMMHGLGFSIEDETH
jgi:erythronate-4-phosphate dehydrogenase